MRFLLITYNWPPRNTIGTHRPFSWAVEWASAGNDVDVLTAKKHSFDEPLDLSRKTGERIKVYEVPYFSVLYKGSSAASNEKKNNQHISLLTKLKSLKNRILQKTGFQIDIRNFWIKPAVLAGKSLLKKNKYDVIVSTFGPRACHLIAYQLSKTDQKIFWVADYRDLWVGNPLSLMPSNLEEKEARLESATVGKRANLLTTVSGGLADSLRKSLDLHVEVVINGHDGVPNFFPKTCPELQTRSIRLVHTGSLYGLSRDPTPLFRSISVRDNIDRDNIKIEFYGARLEGLLDVIKGHGVESIVDVLGHVSHERSLKLQSTASAVLLLSCKKASLAGELPGKLFEYMICGRPVLCIGPSSGSEIDSILRLTGVGIAVGADTDLITATIDRLLDGQNPDWYKPQIAEIESFSRTKQAQKLLRAIQNLLRK